MTNSPQDAAEIVTRLHRLTGLTSDQIASLSLTLNPVQVDQISDSALASLVNGTLPSLPLNPNGGLPLGLPGATQAARFVGGTTSGAPTSGTFQQRDWVVDGTGKFFACTVGGSPGTWVQVSGGGASTSFTPRGAYDPSGATTYVPGDVFTWQGRYMMWIAVPSSVGAQPYLNGGRYVAVDDPHTRVFDLYGRYGADPTGTNSLTPAFDAAYADAKAGSNTVSSGGAGETVVFYLPKGSYACTEQTPGTTARSLVQHEAAYTGGQVVTGPDGARYYDKTNATPNVPMNITFRGDGEPNTTIKFKGPAPAVQCLAAPLGNSDNRSLWRGLTLQDLTLDGDGVALPPNNGIDKIICTYNKLYMNITDMRVERIRTMQLRKPVTGGTRTRGGVDFFSNHLADPAQEATLVGTYPGVGPTVISDIYVNDLTLGAVYPGTDPSAATQGGGNYGIRVSGFRSTSSGTVAGTTVPAQTDLGAASAVAGTQRADTYIDRVFIQRNKWDSGARATEFAAANSSGASVGIQAGGSGFGGLLVVADNFMRGSMDDLYEFSAFRELYVLRNAGKDCLTESLYLRVANGGLASPQQQRILVDGYRYEDETNTLSPALGSATAAVYVHSKDWGVSGGNVTVQNVTARRSAFLTMPGTPASATPSMINSVAVRAVGGFRSLTLRNISGAYIGFTTDLAAFYTASGNTKHASAATASCIEVSLAQDSGVLDIDGVDFTFRGTIVNDNSQAHTAAAVVLGPLANYKATVRNVHTDYGVALSGGGSVTYSDVLLGYANGHLTKQVFNSSSAPLAAGHRADQGSLDDLAANTPTGNALNVVANPTTEWWLSWLHNNEDYTYGQTGPSVDQVMAAKFLLSSSSLTGVKEGVRLKVDGTMNGYGGLSGNGLSGIHCWINTSGLHIALADNGTVGSDKASVAFGTAPAVGETWLVRAQIVDNVVTADTWKTTDVSTSYGTTPAIGAGTNGVQCSYTLSSSTTMANGRTEVQQFGGYRSGWRGLIHKPQDSSGLVTAMWAFHRSVAAIDIEGVEPVTVRGDGTGLSGKPFQAPAGLTGLVRFRRPLSIRRTDLSAYGYLGAANVTEFSGWDTALVAQTRLGSSLTTVNPVAGLAVAGCLEGAAIVSTSQFSGLAVGPEGAEVVVGPSSGAYTRYKVIGGAWTSIGSTGSALSNSVAFPVEQIGTLSVKTGVPLIMPFPGTLRIVGTPRVGTAPTGVNGVTVDLLKNGTSLWNVTPANRIGFAATATSGTFGAFDTTTVVAGDQIAAQITQVGPTLPGADLTFTLVLDRSA